MKISEQQRGPFSDEQSKENSSYDDGIAEEIEYEPVSRVALFEKGSSVEEILAANAQQIQFDRQTGRVRVLDAGGAELAHLPGAQEFARVFVSSNGFSLNFEYRNPGESDFGFLVGRGLKDGELIVRTWAAETPRHGKG